MPRLLLTLTLTLAVLCASGAAPARQAPGPRPHAVAGLELDPPRKVTRVGVAKVAARVTGARDGARVRILWDVAAQFEHPDVEFDWERRDGGRSIQLVIPDSRGVVVVTAWAIVDGEPTSDAPARTAIEVDYTPRGAPKAEPPKAESPKTEAPKGEAPAAPSGAQARKAPRGKVTDAYFVYTADDEADALALVSSQGLRNRLRAAGVTPHLFAADSAAAKAAGLGRYVQDAGGTPAVVLVTAGREVRAARKVTAEDTAESLAREASQ